MTGRELIVYILSNGLEDEPVCKDGRFLGFMTPEEAAVKFNVGVATIDILVQLEMLDAVRIGNHMYIPHNAEYPVTKGASND